jgi:hypothetical protein
MRERDLWLDFNDVGSDSHAQSLLEYATPGSTLSLGSRIVVGDDEGNRCDATVVAIRGDVVEVVVDRGTVHRPDQVDQTSPISS